MTPVPTVVVRRPSTDTRITVAGAAAGSAVAAAGATGGAAGGGGGAWAHAASSTLAKKRVVSRMAQSYGECPGRRPPDAIIAAGFDSRTAVMTASPNDSSRNDPSRVIRAPRGNTLTCKSWL